MFESVSYYSLALTLFTVILLFLDTAVFLLVVAMHTFSRLDIQSLESNIVCERLLDFDVCSHARVRHFLSYSSHIVDTGDCGRRMKK